MKYQIFHFPTFSNEPPVEVKRLELFSTRVGYPCYHLELNLFDKNPDTNSGWAKRAIDPQTGDWIEFPYRSHYTNLPLQFFPVGPRSCPYGVPNPGEQGRGRSGIKLSNFCPSGTLGFSSVPYSRSGLLPTFRK